MSKSKSKSKKKSSNNDDSFTQYLEKLQAEDDNFKDSLDLNYNLDQLGNYQSCYIDNKKAIKKNHGPVPDDIITHLDYLDEGVLIMQPMSGSHKQHQNPIVLDNSSFQKQDVVFY